MLHTFWGWDIVCNIIDAPSIAGCLGSDMQHCCLEWTSYKNHLTPQKALDFPVWITCQKHVEHIKFPINFPIMESKKNFSSQTVLEFGIPIVGNFMFSDLGNIRKTIHILGNIQICKVFLMFSKLENIKFPTISIPNSRIV